MPLVHIYRFTCDVDGCGFMTETKYTVFYPDSVVHPMIPDGWNQFKGRYICHKHTITVEIDQGPHTGMQIKL